MDVKLVYDNCFEMRDVIVKKIIVLLLILLFALGSVCFAVPPNDDKYYQVYDSDDMKLYFNTSSLGVGDGLLKFELYMEYSDERLKKERINKDREFDHSIGGMMVDIKKYRYRALSISNYREDGSVIDNYNFEKYAKWTELNMESPLATSVKNIMVWMEKSAE